VGSLTETQQSIVIGSLLGDGAMRCKANALLEINHCLEQQEYVDWKYRSLADLVSTPPKARRGNGSRWAYRFTTRSLPSLTPYFRSFYEEGRKLVPAVSITPLSLAVWFMDDGSKTHRALYLNTQQFNLASQGRLVELLQDQWNIKSTLNRDKTYFRLRIAVESVSRFKSLVDPYLLPMFRYKIPS
jgi:recombination protein RecA